MIFRVTVRFALSIILCFLFLGVIYSDIIEEERKDDDFSFAEFFPDFLKEDIKPYVNQSTVELLDSHGLNILVENFYSFLMLFDHATALSHHLSEKENFEILNDIINGIKKSFITTVFEITKSKNAPTGIITPQMMSNFIDRQKIHFNELLKDKIPPGLDQQVWSIMFTRVDLVFESFKTLYEMTLSVLPVPLQLTWSQLQFIAPFLEFLPTTEILQHSHFETFLLIPAHAKKILHDFIASLFSVDKSHLTRTIIDLIKMYDWQRLLKPAHEDL